MRFLDCHTHATGFDLWNLGAQRFPTSQSARDLALKVRQAGIDYAVCFPLATSFYFDANATVRGRVSPGGPEEFPYALVNNQHLREVALFGDGTLLPFLCIDPLRHVDRQIELLEQAKGSIFGLKLHTRTTNSSPLDLRGTGLLEFAEAAGLPLLIHAAAAPSNCRPELILDLADMNPEVRMCIAHAAGFDLPSLERAAATPNVFVDPSPLLTNCVEALRSATPTLGHSSFSDPASILRRLAELLPDTLVWGSDEPWTAYCGPDGEVWTMFDYADEVAILKAQSPNHQAAIGWRTSCRWLFGASAGQAESVIQTRLADLARFGGAHPFNG